MGRTVSSAAARVEENKVARAPERTAESSDKVDRLALVPLRMAQMRMGECIAEAMADEPVKRFGSKGQMSHVKSGEKVPKYLAQIWLDRNARTRFALALLNGTKVRKRVVLEWDDDDQIQVK